MIEEILEQRKTSCMWFMKRISVFMGKGTEGTTLERVNVDGVDVVIRTSNTCGIEPVYTYYKIPHEVFFSDASLKEWAREDRERQALEKQEGLEERRELARLKEKYERKI